MGESAAFHFSGWRVTDSGGVGAISQNSASARASTPRMVPNAMTTAFAVLQDPDLVAAVLRDNCGAATVIAAGCVCRVWRAAAAQPEVVRAAALYTGGLTKQMFMSFFALSNAKAGAYEHERCLTMNAKCRPYYMFRAPAVDKALLGREERRNHKSKRGVHGLVGTDVNFRREQHKEERLRAQQGIDRMYDAELQRFKDCLPGLDAEEQQGELERSMKRLNELSRRFNEAAEPYAAARRTQNSRMGKRGRGGGSGLLGM